MDNYKIKVKDEAESKEAQELFFELGAKRPDGTTNLYHSPTVFGILVVEGLLNYVFADVVFRDSGAKELTLPRLRDLVVLKRNDVKDANHRDKQQKSIYLTSENIIYYWDGEWLNSAINKSNDYENYIANSLTPIVKSQDKALLSTHDVWIALWKDQNIQYSFDYDNNWQEDIASLKIEDIKSGHYQFRLKPKTIKFDLEIPAPYKAKIGGRDDTSFVLNVGRHQYLYQNEDDYTKARNALEAVFDAALGGNNS